MEWITDEGVLSLGLARSIMMLHYMSINTQLNPSSVSSTPRLLTHLNSPPPPLLP